MLLPELDEFLGFESLIKLSVIPKAPLVATPAEYVFTASAGIVATRLTPAVSGPAPIATISNPVPPTAPPVPSKVVKRCPANCPA